MTLLQRLDQLRLDLDQYYETTFENDIDDTRENGRLKSRIRDLIIDAHTAGHPEVVRLALDLLSHSTGCAEDYEIFVHIAEDLIAKKIVDQDELDKYLAKSAVNRWL